MESVLGKSDGMVTHAVVPFRFGFENGGRADVVHFREHVAGAVYATCELIGCDDQIPNRLGNYELAICHRGAETWGIDIINALAYYTLDSKIEPGDTMELGPSAPKNSIIYALLFYEFGRFVVRGREAGILLCLGITPDEMVACQNGYCDEVEAALLAKGVYPFSDRGRRSTLA